MADNTKYLKYDADSMVSYLRSTISSSGRFTDQLYDGSNISVMIETLAALFEVIMYQQNFQAAEATFTSVNAYENMVKLLSIIGYKPRLCISSNVYASLNGNISLEILNNSINSMQSTNTFGELISTIESNMKYITQSKILTRDLSLADATNSLQYTVTNETLCYPQLKYDDQTNIFYYYKNNGRAGILQYLVNLWADTMTEFGASQLYSATEETTLGEIIDNDRGETGFSAVNELYIVGDDDVVECNFITSSNPDKNYVTFTNGRWYSYFVTNATAGMALEEYIIDVNVERELPANGTLYAIVCDTNKNLNNNGVDEFSNACEIWTGVRNLRDYTSADKVFSYGVNTEKTISIQFGDGVYGQQLPINKQIVLYYIRSDGAGAAVAKGNFSNNAIMFSNNILETAGASISQNLSSNYAKAVNNKFYYGSLQPIIKTGNIETSTIISKLIADNNNTNDESVSDSMQPAQPAVTIYATVLDNATSFYDLESVQYMKSMAPMYNRTNNRVVTRNDLKTFMENEFSENIYDVAIMNNYDYMATFYSWLYKYNKLSKSIRTYGYKFADACDFNNIYIWVKGFTRFPINDFYKKSIEYNLLNKKPLTAEPVILDTFNTNFYPYVGNIQDDIEWLSKCIDYYTFIGDSSNKNRLMNLFDKDANGNIKMTVNGKLINYILADSSDNKEIKVQLDVYRDTNTTTNIASIANDVSTTITNYFDVKNHKLGENFNGVELGAKLYDIKGVSKVVTNKMYNISIYNALPFVNSYYYNQLDNTTSSKILYGVPLKYNATTDNNKYIGNCLLEFSLDMNGKTIPFTDLMNKKYTEITWYKRNLITGDLQKMTFIPNAANGTFDKYVTDSDGKKYVDIESNIEVFDYVDSNNKTISEYNQSFYVSGTTVNTAEWDTSKQKPKPYILDETQSNSIDIGEDLSLKYTVNPTKCFYNIQLDKNNFKSDRISIYAEIRSVSGVLYKTNITTINLIGIDNYNSVSKDNDNRCESYYLSSELDTYSTQFVNTSKNTTWESIDSTSMLSLAKWNSKILDGVDFEVIGSGIYKLEDFCFPMLFKPITINVISIKEDNLDNSIDIEY